MKIPRSVLSGAFVLSLAGFCLGLVLHGSTYFGFDPRSNLPITWYSFQLITAFAFIPALISLGRRDLHTTATYDGFRWGLGLVTAIFILYAAFNFIFTSEFFLRGYEPKIISNIGNDQYFLSAHGFHHPITKAEYLKYSIYWTRENSGHWMAICTLVATELYDHLLGPRANQNMSAPKKA
ncbi:MAG TPA: hypothetical protein VK117_04285 [Pyrinomonadaceae bacterium]|nr:hypothetical protein [Pyrinomonadaceae bacterium]